MLRVEDFPDFFTEVHGCEPFPWQTRLTRQLSEKGEWPATIQLPTGCGKTAALDIAVFHLALEADRGSSRRAPLRIAFVVDRRLIVDDAFARARKIQDALATPKNAVTARVADRLGHLAGDGPPLRAQRLRGGVPREDDWSRTPSQPTILCSTVDQVGSRLLFRGYGVSDSMKPIHAGLLGSDCLFLLDEAHLAEPFRQTLEWIRMYQEPKWREVDSGAPWGAAILTATPNANAIASFDLDDADRAHAVLHRRLSAVKRAHLIETSRAGRQQDGEKTGDDTDLGGRVDAIVEQVNGALEHVVHQANGTPAPAIGVVVNRVARARAVFERLTSNLSTDSTEGRRFDAILMIGPARPVDRDDLVSALRPIRTGASRDLSRPLILVATQCIEAGVDIDLDALVTELAPLDALRQRFGRLNRAGRDIVPFAAILAMKADLSPKVEDPVYGRTLGPAWERLVDAARKEGDYDVVDFGLINFAVRMDSEAISEKDDAPVLLPAHLDLLRCTSPIPAADPDVARYLHGPSRQPDAITVVWRGDISAADDADNVRRLLLLVPPRATEAIELPIWAVRKWLAHSREPQSDLADISTRGPADDSPRRDGLAVFRWKGDDAQSRWIVPADVRPGDTIVAPATYRGLDKHGWYPGQKDSDERCSARERISITPNEPDEHTFEYDVAQVAAQPFAGRRFAVRVAPGLLSETLSTDALADALAGAPPRDWRALRDVLLGLPLPDAMRKDLELLDRAKARPLPYLDVYGVDNQGRPRGVIFVAPLGIKGEPAEMLGQSSTEDDDAGSLSGGLVRLDVHNRQVGTKAELFARRAGLPEARVGDVRLAGALHDLGKGDPRYQAWLQYGDPLGPDTELSLAKSPRPLPRTAREASGLPPRWRHEALSVRLAKASDQLAMPADPELVLWLIGTHHGYGRPFYPHQDWRETAPNVGPQSLSFDFRGQDWATLFARLSARYGVWELARMEAIVRLADHRASEEAIAEIAAMPRDVLEPEVVAT